MPGLEKALQGKAAGSELQVTVSPEEGYGVYNSDLVKAIPITALAGIENIEVGMHLQLSTEQGESSVGSFRSKR